MRLHCVHDMTVAAIETAALTDTHCHGKLPFLQPNSNIRIRSTFDSVVRPNMNTLFRPNRMRVKRSVQPCHLVISEDFHGRYVESNLPILINRFWNVAAKMTVSVFLFL